MIATEARASALALAFALAFVSLVGGTARAEPTLAERNLAQALFDDGRAALAAGRIDEACAKLAESYRIDASSGTLLNLGLCHERQGRMASAHVELSESISRAIKDGRPERERTAREHLAVVASKLSRLTVAVGPAAKTSGLVVKLDGVVMSNVAWGVATPADPGEHVVEASAPGKRAYRAVVNVGRDGDNATLEIVVLADDAASPAGTASPAPRADASAATAAPPPPATTSPFPGDRAPPTASPKPDGGGRTLAWVALGVGATGVAVGGVFGGVALAKWSAAKDHCPGHACATSADASTYGGAGGFADVSTVGFVVGGAGLVAGAVLWLAGGSGAAAAADAVVPVVARDGGGIEVRGRL